jgi:hypothetical protein
MGLLWFFNDFKLEGIINYPHGHGGLFYVGSSLGLSMQGLGLLFDKKIWP